jgi:adenine-specific DNA-methyltransferase
MAKSKDNGSSRIDAVHRKDNRKIIPTEELRDFVADDDQNPRAILYPRNPDLDPQLACRGTDGQDKQRLEVPAVLIYIQEEVHSQAIIEDFRRSATDEGGDPEGAPSPCRRAPMQKAATSRRTPKRC